MNTRPLSRDETKARTRTALLAAGRETFIELGYHATSLSAVAARAGYTKGAVYAHFATKADLFIAIVEARGGLRAAAFADAARDAQSVAELRATADSEWAAIMRDEAPWITVLIEFWLHAARDAALLERLKAARARQRQAISGAIADLVQRTGEALPMPASDIALLHVTLGNGMALEQILGAADADDFLRISERLER